MRDHLKIVVKKEIAPVYGKFQVVVDVKIYDQSTPAKYTINFVKNRGCAKLLDDVLTSEVELFTDAFKYDEQQDFNFPNNLSIIL